jgi:hypothetical protein
MVRLLLICVLGLAAAAALADDAVVWVASPWQHVLRDTPPGRDRVVNLKAAANEYESARIIVRAGSAGLTAVNATATDLTGKAGVIPASAITFYREHYIHITKPSYASKAPIGWYPDALIPFRDPQTGEDIVGAKYDAAPFDVAAGGNQGIWVEVRVPRDARAGIYAGRINLTVGDKPLASVPVRLEVWGFALPDTIAMRSEYGLEGVDPAEKDQYISALIDHRCMPSELGAIWPQVTPDGKVDDSASGERLRHLIEDRHVNSLMLPFGYGEDPAALKQRLHALAAYLRAKGWLDLAYIYLLDEPNDAAQYQIVRDQGKLIHEADPGLKGLCTEQTLTSDPAWGTLNDAVDIWCPLWALHDEETAKAEQAKGKELWSYTALCQGPPTIPFWQIDFPPVVYRAPFWTDWHYGMTGFLYWAATYWEKGKDPWVEPSFRDSYWGEGMLLYPGKDAGIAGPVTSIRLKLIREAMEDYEYMTLAAKQGKKAQVDAIVAGITTSFANWSHDPQAYADARAKLAGMIARR